MSLRLADENIYRDFAEILRILHASTISFAVLNPRYTNDLVNWPMLVTHLPFPMLRRKTNRSCRGFKGTTRRGKWLVSSR